MRRFGVPCYGWQRGSHGIGERPPWTAPDWAISPTAIRGGEKSFVQLKSLHAALDGQHCRRLRHPICARQSSRLSGFFLMKTIAQLSLVFACLFLQMITGCGGSAGSSRRSTSNGGTGTGTGTTAPLSLSNINLIFVVSEDLAYQASGDVNPSTANLTNQGLQRSLLMAPFLQQQVLGTKNATGIYVLQPMSHLQTANNYPDIVAPETVQQFALLNQITLSTASSGYSNPYTANSYPINASYASGFLPSGVAMPTQFCASCQGFDFNDQGGANEALVRGMIQANVPGFYVFSAPWETTSSLLANINNLESYNLTLPTSYQGPNYIYVISITPSGSARLANFNSNVNPASTYPALPQMPASTACTSQMPFSITVTGGSGGAVIPAGSNINETFYMIRHADAHPQGSWDDGNYVGAGQWRALDLPNALKGKISPNQVYSIDPAQPITGTQSASGYSTWSYVRPALTVEPYAIANNLPYNLAANFGIFASNGPQLASEFFFNGGKFSHQSILLAWEHNNIPLTVDALLSSYFPLGGAPTAPVWPSNDYDTIWTVALDGSGNLTVNNSMCEGIQSTALPSAAPQF